jgi:ATP-binding cassette subfamily G (WHITE) protein 2
MLLYWRLKEPELSDVGSVQNRVGALYFLSVNFLVLYLQNSLSTFPKNQLIFVKEYESGLYDVLPYYLSKILVEILFTSIFPTIFTLLVYFTTNLNLSVKCFFTFLGGTILYIQIATLMGILIGTIVQSPSLAVEVAPAIFVPMMLFSGYTNNVNNYWVGIKWLQYISPVRYFMEFAVTNEFEDRENLKLQSPMDTLGFTFGVPLTALLMCCLYVGISVLSFIFLYRGAQKGIIN